MMKFSFGGRMGPSVVLKEETLAADEVKSLAISAAHEALELVAGPERQITIRQYGASGRPPEEWFVMEKQGGHVRANIPHMLRIGVFMSFGEEKLVIEVPRSWLGDISLTAASGGVVVKDAFTWGHVKLESTSGTIRLLQALTCQSLLASSTSGGVRAEDVITAAGDITASSTSGSVRINGAAAANGTIRLSSSSGGVRTQNPMQAGQMIEMSASSGSIKSEAPLKAPAVWAKSTSGGIRLQTVQTDSYDFTTSSGSIRMEGVSGSGTMKSTSGGITAHLRAPVGQVLARSTSGSVRITVPPELSFTLEARTTSGGIHTDFELYYRDTNQKQAFATVGANPQASLQLEATSGSLHITR